MSVAAMFLTPVAVMLLAGAPPGGGDSAWSIDKPLAAIPDKPLTGQLFGKDFKLKSASIDKISLTLESEASDGSSWADRQLVIFLSKDKLDKGIVVLPEQDDVPHVHMTFVRPGKQFPRTLMYVHEYSMRIEVVERRAEAVTLRIHISLPDYHKSYLVGTVVVGIR